MSLYQVNVVKLYGPQDGVITLQEDGDGLGMVHVSSSGEYYGKFEFNMEPDEAIVLANAIIQQANYLKGK
jgi:hypothetical protein